MKKSNVNDFIFGLVNQEVTVENFENLQNELWECGFLANLDEDSYSNLVSMNKGDDDEDELYEKITSILIENKDEEVEYEYSDNSETNSCCPWRLLVDIPALHMSFEFYLMEKFVF